MHHPLAYLSESTSHTPHSRNGPALSAGGRNATQEVQGEPEQRGSEPSLRTASLDQEGWGPSPEDAIISLLPSHINTVHFSSKHSI